MNKSILTIGLLLAVLFLVLVCTAPSNSTSGSGVNAAGNPLLAFAQTFNSKAPAGFSITYR